MEWKQFSSTVKCTQAIKQVYFHPSLLVDRQMIWPERAAMIGCLAHVHLTVGSHFTPPHIYIYIYTHVQYNIYIIMNQYVSPQRHHTLEIKLVGWKTLNPRSLVISRAYVGIKGEWRDLGRTYAPLCSLVKAPEYTG